MKPLGSPVRAVLFDLGNTLVSYYRARDFAPILRTCIANLCDFLAQRRSAIVDPVRAFEHALELNAEDPSGRVRLLADRLLEIFADEELSNADVNAMCAIFLEPIFRLGVLDANALATIAAIRRRGIRTSIVSNTPWGSPRAAWAGELHRHGLADAVDAAIFCIDVGWRKPAPPIFQHALSVLDVDAEDAVFVGDDARQDVAGAQRSGLRAMLIDPHGAPGGLRCPVIRSLAELPGLLDSMAL